MRLVLFELVMESGPRWFSDEEAARAALDSHEGCALVFRVETWDMPAEALLAACMNREGIAESRVPIVGHLGEEEPVF